MDFVWMRHPGISDPARFPVDAVDTWRARGWEPADPPADRDPTAEKPAAPAAEQADTPTGDEQPTTPTTAGRRRRADSEESR